MIATHNSAFATVEDDAAVLDAEISRIFTLQREHRWVMAQTTAAERRGRLVRLKQAILAHRSVLYQAFQTDFAKPEVEVEMLEIQPVLAEIEHAIASIEGWMRPQPVHTPLLLFHGRSQIRHEPKGVVLILGPWNYPFLLLISPLVAAVAAGNCAILRPSEKVPQVAAVMRSIVEASFAKREVALVVGEIELADALLRLPFDHFFFTGSGAVGRKVMHAAADHLASVTLELGGKSPAIIEQSADLATATERLVWGRFLNAGQTCVSPDYVLVHHSQHDAFLAEAKRVLTAMYGSSDQARLQSPDLPQMIDSRAFERLTQLLAAAQAAGAHVELGGQSNPATRRIAPTVLSHVTADNPIMAEEIFGPILPVLAYSSLDEALHLIAAMDKPLALYIFSQNAGAIEYILAQTTAGGTVINNTVVHLANSYLPFGGVGASGQGNYHGEFGFRAFSHQRAVMRQSRLFLGKLFYPPYTSRSRAIARLNRQFLYSLLPRLRRFFPFQKE